MNTLAAFIHAHRDAIVGEWLSRAATLPNGRTLSEPALRDHVPEMLDTLADAIDHRDETARALADLPEQHAAVRFRDGYDLPQVVAEYRLLRNVILEKYALEDDISAESRPKMEPLRIMHEAVDRAIAEAVDHYAAERDRIRETFIAMLGHDLRDPLNTILFSATRLWERGETLDATAVKTAARIATTARRMERMIADLLDFARGRLGGGFVIQPTTFDARPLIAHTVHEIADGYPEREIRCLAETAEGDFTVRWDADRVAQLLTNLVGNALMHGEDPVVVEAHDDGATIELVVRNAGEIPPEVRPHLFDPFASDNNRTGLGLGLYIVQEIVRAHGGAVSPDSSGGHTAFTATLPRRAPSPSPNRP
jgi:signal transduction histidine kinase